MCFKSLFYNHHLNQSYVSDVCLEPIFWFVDNFTHLLGPVSEPMNPPPVSCLLLILHPPLYQIFVVGVILLTTTVVFIAYWIGLPYWWATNRPVTVLLVIFGNWLLLNVSFHYYKAVVTPPGDSPRGNVIAAAVSVCKKCIAPKAARTHHCSVCNKCILKMDHHCRTYTYVLRNQGFHI